MTSAPGYLAALATSIAWTFTSVFFTLAGRRVGSVIVNRTRLLLAIVFVTIMHWITEGAFYPIDAEPFRFGWLALSGVIGFVIGDGFLFQALVMIGPRLSMLLMALAPIFSTVIGWVFFGEVLSVQELLGIGLTISGVTLVIVDRQIDDDQDDLQQEDDFVDLDETPSRSRRYYVIGVLFGLGAALGQAGGLVASRLGLEGDFPALSGNLIRLTAAGLLIWLIALFQRQVKHNFIQLKTNPPALKAITGGAIAGPFIGVWLSLIAIQLAPLGIAATLMSLAPVFLLPVSRILFKEKIGFSAIMGTVLAFAGTVLIFLPELHW